MVKYMYAGTRRYLYEKEKRDRALFFNEFNDGFDSVDVEEFVKQDIFEETVDHEFIFEMGVPLDGLPRLYCPKCDKETFIPKTYKTK